MQTVRCMRSVRSLASKPVPGPPAPVGYRDNLDSGVRFAEDDEEGKSVEEIATSAAQVWRPLPRPPFDVFDRCVKFRHESFASVERSAPDTTRARLALP